jgi:hypothetical protein
MVQPGDLLFCAETMSHTVFRVQGLRRLLVEVTRGSQPKRLTKNIQKQVRQP